MAHQVKPVHTFVSQRDVTVRGSKWNQEEQDSKFHSVMSQWVLWCHSLFSLSPTNLTRIWWLLNGRGWGCKSSMERTRSIIYTPIHFKNWCVFPPIPNNWRHVGKSHSCSFWGNYNTSGYNVTDRSMLGREKSCSTPNNVHTNKPFWTMIITAGEPKPQAP